MPKLTAATMAKVLTTMRRIPDFDVDRICAESALSFREYKAVQPFLQWCHDHERVPKWGTWMAAYDDFCRVDETA